MVASEFVDFFQKFSYANRVAVEDLSDRLNLFTVVLFLLACIIVSAKQYFLNSMSCYIPVKPTGENFNGYLADYCWVHGTIPLHPDERLPNTVEEWDKYDEHRRITYYQWVPFVLGLQCILFYIPHIAWQATCAIRSGGDLFALVKSAAEASTKSRGDRTKAVAQVVEFLEDMIGVHKSCRRGRRSRIARKAFDTCGILVASKRLGTRLVWYYLIVKIIIIVNAVMQIYLIQRFLGFHASGSAGQRSLQLGKTHDTNALESINDPVAENTNGFGFGLTVANHIRSGRDWPETLLFPRVAYCRVPGIRLVGVENTYTAQCTLPINMLNEKLYIFFWFWILLLIIISSVSLLLWLLRMIFAPQRKNFIKRYLRVKNITKPNGEPVESSDLNEFIDEYLRHDGVFLVRMLSINTGDVITSEIVSVLYTNYCEHLRLEHEHDHDNNEKKPLNPNENFV